MKNEPLNRYEIHEDLDKELQKKERFGDPMKQLLKVLPY